MNTASVAAAAIPASLVLISGSGLLALKSAVRKGCTVTFGVSFKLTPPTQPDTFKADASRFQKVLDEALEAAAADWAGAVRAPAEAAQPVPEPQPSPVPAPVQAAA